MRIDIQVYTYDRSDSHREKVYQMLEGSGVGAIMGSFRDHDSYGVRWTLRGPCLKKALEYAESILSMAQEEKSDD